MDFLKSFSTETVYIRFFGLAIDLDDAVEKMIPGLNSFALLAMREGKVLAHAAYYASSPTKAESAIVVADAYQAKGLGTILLGQLAEAASRAGISALGGLVRPENYRIIKVLRQLGFPVDQKIEPGQIRISFPTSSLRHTPSMVDCSQGNLRTIYRHQDPLKACPRLQIETLLQSLRV